MRFLTVDPEKCVKCGTCEKACQFGAILIIKEEIFFKAAACALECRACELACPKSAAEISECTGCASKGGCNGCRGCGGCKGK